MIERNLIGQRIPDIFQLKGLVSNGILNRVVAAGGIPQQGPGRFSVPNALDREKRRKSEQEKQGKDGKPPLTSLQRRREWNLNNQLSPRRR